MQIDFFATDNDLVQVWKWLFDVPDMKLFEDYSAPDQANGWYEKWEDFCNRFEVQKGGLAAWPMSVGGMPRKKPIVFEPETQQKLGAKGRTVLEGPALIHIHGLGEVRGCLGNSSMKCLNERGARQHTYYPEDFCDEVDWPQFRSIVAKIQRQLKKTCPAKLRHVAIMPDAFAKFQSGQIKLWNWGQECKYPSEHVTVL